MQQASRPDRRLDLSDERVLAFWRERHLCTLTTLRPDGTPHVVPVGATLDPEAGVARVITSAGTRKARNAAAGGPVALCQVDGRRWATIEGRARVLDSAEAVADAEARYAVRYKPPRPNPERVVIEIAIERIIGLV
ncbi:pyridoxamine 5'-phosphate oxidase family protein [Actinomadura macrotermitis]|uniref:F420H(2)-dependent biliverdin reductase n=1 Tax=Actinomadura macrotermitis TaxID=2585200 RepID=A0A7K0BU92_9ACTN|nr:PPOX class F420-dependent oxidoreductase [Actinomadura macrotermitis]MQY04721.1 F420H(2)-dependent biliverdin reductase [Actinomadura macrotermitis]